MSKTCQCQPAAAGSGGHGTEGPARRRQRWVYHSKALQASSAAPKPTPWKAVLPDIAPTTLFWVKPVQPPPQRPTFLHGRQTVFAKEMLHPPCLKELFALEMLHPTLCTLVWRGGGVQVHPDAQESLAAPLAHLWYGSEGSRTRPHFDMYENFFVQVRRSPQRTFGPLSSLQQRADTVHQRSSA